jgi:hypothetical protein
MNPDPSTLEDAIFQLLDYLTTVPRPYRPKSWDSHHAFSEAEDLGLVYTDDALLWCISELGWAVWNTIYWERSRELDAMIGRKHLDVINGQLVKRKEGNIHEH